MMASAQVCALEYRHDDFGFSVRVPSTLKLCMTPSPGPNHGFVALSRLSDCDDLIKRPRLELFVEYNVAHEAETPEALANDACGSHAKATEATNDGSAIYQCQYVVSGGLNTTRYYFLRKKPNKWVGQWVVVYLSVYADGDITESDKRRAKELLSRIHWFEP